jgi:methyl-accepting chemotaxis protein
MGKELESGMDLLKSIEEITERSRLIAFNMAVEAARIGEKGRGFKVIVGELRKLNDMTADFSGQVAELLGRFRDYNASIVGRLAEETDRVSRDVAGGMEAAERAVESLIAASGTADSFAHEIAALAVVIDSDLDGVLESLQFQDITRQMIEGSNAMLDEASADIDASLTAIGRLEAARRNVILLESIRKTLLARSKTRGEKEAIMEVKE